MSDIEFRPEFESVVNVANKNYTDLQNKPSINGHELEGDKNSSDLGIATKVSELENDENFQENVIETISVNDTPLVPEEKAVNINVPVNVSELENDAEYITDDDVPVKSISVNSTPIEPDEDGNVNIEIEEPDVPVKSISVNSTPVSPDGEGNVDITVPEVPTPTQEDVGRVIKVDENGEYILDTDEGQSTFAGLTDTNISSPSNGQVATYNSTSGKWENKAVPAELPTPASSGADKGKVLFVNNQKKWDKGAITFNNGDPSATVTKWLGNLQVGGSSGLTLEMRTQVASEFFTVDIYLDSQKYVLGGSDTWETIIKKLNGGIGASVKFAKEYYDEDTQEYVEISYDDTLYDPIYDEKPFRVVFSNYNEVILQTYYYNGSLYRYTVRVDTSDNTVNAYKEEIYDY